MSEDKDIDYWVEKAYEGDISATFTLGDMLLKQAQNEEEYQNAITWITAAADKDHFEAKLTLGKIFLHGTHYEDFGDDAKYYSQRIFEQAHSIAIDNENIEQQADALYHLGKSAEMPVAFEGDRSYVDAINFYTEAVETSRHEPSIFALNFLRNSKEASQQYALPAPKGNTITNGFRSDQIWLQNAIQNYKLILSPLDTEYNELAFQLEEISEKTFNIALYLDEHFSEQFSDQYTTQFSPELNSLYTRFEEYPSLETGIEMLDQLHEAHKRVSKQIKTGFLHHMNTGTTEMPQNSAQMLGQTIEDIRNDLYIVQSLSQSLHEHIIEESYKNTMHISHQP
tara:strand:- start:102 stop:1118 length:1017 start_codon:yes stop_codon:yes gene_type:complete